MVDGVTGGAVTFEAVGGGGFKGKVSLKKAVWEEVQLPTDAQIEVLFRDGSTVLIAPGELFGEKNNVEDIQSARIFFGLDDLSEGVVNAEVSILKNLGSISHPLMSTKEEVDSLKTATGGIDIIMLFSSLMAALIATRASIQLHLAMESQVSTEEIYSLGMRSADLKEKAAEKKRDAVQIQAIFDIAAGGVQALGGFVASFLPTNMNKSVLGISQGVAQIVKSAGKCWTSHIQCQSELATIASEVLQAESTKIQAYNQSTSATISNLQQSIAAAIHAFKSFLDTINQAKMALASAIGGR
ncbi:MAG: hypothetical protein LBI69_04295 [Puniceicoccales bacterium]|jgi:hypothetical protein|nr:hypothetical protein [Puniceicoccales bacterium]